MSPQELTKAIRKMAKLKEGAEEARKQYFAAQDEAREHIKATLTALDKATSKHGISFGDYLDIGGGKMLEIKTADEWDERDYLTAIEIKRKPTTPAAIAALIEAIEQDQQTQCPPSP
ncbi:hypothetical protein JW897_06485 [Chromobacterium alkanivorans]|uniref:hypothetical protein n=1 Tax=Chromobacterium alkanivorans TaxID=1071719 RepID=UPI001966DFB6|nr:hypothetical protein [Chromobacterium alkanivorans]MBN3003383.1 hypothetical protein [Chromobacterium alkanivorans]